jgi:hypothetical protein
MEVSGQPDSTAALLQGKEDWYSLEVLVGKGAVSSCG